MNTPLMDYERKSLFALIGLQNALNDEQRLRQMLADIDSLTAQRAVKLRDDVALAARKTDYAFDVWVRVVRGAHD